MMRTRTETQGSRACVAGRAGGHINHTILVRKRRVAGALVGRATRLLALLMLALPAVALTQDFTYTTNDGAITITGYTGPGGMVTITNSINGLPVTSIGDGAFYQRTAVAGVTLPASITNLGNYVFDGCANLASVTIPANVSRIGVGAFANCFSLTAIEVDPLNPSYASVDGILFDITQTTLVQYPAAKPGAYEISAGVSNILDGALASCSNLTAITVAPLNPTFSSVDGVLFDSTGRTLLQYPGKAGSYAIATNVTRIGYEAFASCAGLAAVAIPASVTAIGDSAFVGCTSLLNVTIPASVTTIGIFMFEGCAALTNVNLPATITSLGAFAFDGCTSLAGITIPHSVTTIGDFAFDGCTSLTNVTIPAGVINLGNFVFADCSRLKAINVDPNNIAYSELAGVLFDKSAITLLECPGGTTGTYIVAHTVASIADFAFYNCAGLTTIGLPSSVSSIGKSAFTGCTALTAIIVDLFNLSYTSVDGVLFDKSVTTLLQYRAGVAGSYTVPLSVSTIGDNAFAYATNLTAAYFQGNAPTPGLSIFSADTNVIVYYLPGTTGWGATYGGVPAVLWNPRALRPESQLRRGNERVRIHYHRRQQPRRGGGGRHNLSPPDLVRGEHEHTHWRLLVFQRPPVGAVSRTFLPLPLAVRDRTNTVKQKAGGVAAGFFIRENQQATASRAHGVAWTR